MGAPKKYVYFHMCSANGPIENFANIITTIMDKMNSTGLMDDVEEIRYVVLGDAVQKAMDIMNLYPKTKCCFTHPDNLLYERATLHHLLNDCQNMEKEAHIMYVHSKGVSNLQYREGIKSWTLAMLEGLTMYRNLCWRYLESGADAVGSFMNPHEWVHTQTGSVVTKHFMGNFWWSSSRHLSSLDKIGEKYLDPEMWILGSKPNIRYVCIDQYLSLQNFVNDFYENGIRLDWYLQNIVFRNTEQPFPKQTIQFQHISSIDIGLPSQWVPCEIIPPPGENISLNLQTLGNPEDVFPQVVKIVRVHTTSGTILYFIEHEFVDIIIA